MNLILIPAAVVMVHCIYMIAHLNPREWRGQRFYFSGLAMSYSLTAGGAVGIAIGWTPGPLLLLFGLAGLIIFDRRKCV